MLEIHEKASSDNELNSVPGWILCLEPSSTVLVKLVLVSKKEIKGKVCAYLYEVSKFCFVVVPMKTERRNYCCVSF